MSEPSAVEVIAEALEPHWRTDCSNSIDEGEYVRWVKCRCGWASARSKQATTTPALHRIWNGHIAERTDAALKAAGFVVATRDEIRAWPVSEQAELIGGEVETYRWHPGSQGVVVSTPRIRVRGPWREVQP